MYFERPTLQDAVTLNPKLRLLLHTFPLHTRAWLPRLASAACNCPLSSSQSSSSRLSLSPCRPTSRLKALWHSSSCPPKASFNTSRNQYCSME